MVHDGVVSRWSAPGFDDDDDDVFLWNREIGGGEWESWWMVVGY